MDGWIKIHRQMLDWDVYESEPFTKAQAWIDLLLLTHYSEEPSILFVRGNEVEIHKGQIGWSEDRLSKKWKWSRNKVRRYLNYLETKQQIKQQKSSVLKVITVINWDKYQVSETTDETTEKQQKDNRKNTNKKDKKEKKDNNISLDFIHESIRPLIERWVKYKKDQHKFTYKSEDTLKSFFNKLIKLSNGIQENAEKIIDNSISNGYQGIFALKPDEIVYPKITKELAKNWDREKWEQEGRLRRLPPNKLEAMMLLYCSKEMKDNF